MTKQTLILVLAGGLCAAGCADMSSSRTRDNVADGGLVGAWRGKVQFKSTAWAEVKDLEFMYVFNAGGTMTESSNHDEAMPVPPAYGVWRKTGPKQFEAKYSFYTTKPPAGFDEIAKGGGWLPAGYGVLVERITLSEDGKTFKSTIKYDEFDQAGKSTAAGVEAETQAARIEF